MFDQQDDGAIEWTVLVNELNQYSLWMAINTIPSGWRAVGPSGSKEICLAYVAENWKDPYIGARGRTGQNGTECAD